MVVCDRLIGRWSGTAGTGALGAVGLTGTAAGAGAVVGVMSQVGCSGRPPYRVVVGSPQPRHGAAAAPGWDAAGSVSYTHLTLPTTERV